MRITRLITIFSLIFMVGCITPIVKENDNKGRIPDVEKPIKPPSLTNEWNEATNKVENVK